jgi:hypothetical protein
VPSKSNNRPSKERSCGGAEYDPWPAVVDMATDLRLFNGKEKECKKNSECKEGELFIIIFDLFLVCDEILFIIIRGTKLS